jgi:FHA domain
LAAPAAAPPAAPTPAASPAAGSPEWLAGGGWRDRAPLTRPGRPAGPPDAQAQQLSWTATVTADRGYYNAVTAAGGPQPPRFPDYIPDQRYLLIAPRMRVGRSHSGHSLRPDIDLTGALSDPGVSRLHAVLVAEQAGTWAVLDSGSSNGTMVNGRTIPTGIRVSLNDGDRIHLGAWTMLTIRAQ